VGGRAVCHFAGGAKACALPDGRPGLPLLRARALSSRRRRRRVLQPGGVFLLVTLGAPEHRLRMIDRPEYGWTIQVCLLPKTQESQ
jgi:hypothetical protein